MTVIQSDIVCNYLFLPISKYEILKYAHVDTIQVNTGLTGLIDLINHGDTMKLFNIYDWKYRYK